MSERKIKKKFETLLKEIKRVDKNRATEILMMFASQTRSDTIREVCNVVDKRFNELINLETQTPTITQENINLFNSELQELIKDSKNDWEKD